MIYIPRDERDRYVDSNDPNRCSWNRELENGLPDSRLRGPRRRATTIPWGRMMLERVFCANCGCSGGGVTSEWSPHVFYLCNGCARDNGPPPGVVQVNAADEAKIRGGSEAGCLTPE